jgi:membrane-associated phospholipid phosphatase
VNRGAGIRRVYFAIVLAVLLLGCAFLLDAPVHHWMTAHFSPAGEAIARKISKWGDWPSHVAVGAIGLLISAVVRNRTWTGICLAMLLACAIAGIVSPTVKTLSGRSRPNVTTSVGWTGPSFDQKHQSFPSGHTMSSTAFFTALLLARRRIGLILLPIPLVIASSRVYLSAHHLSDVVCGLVLGVGCALLAWQIVRTRFPRLTSD